MKVEAQIKKKVESWRWRMVKASGSMSKFCEATGRSQSQVSEWLTGKKAPKPETVDSVEADLKAMGA